MTADRVDPLDGYVTSFRRHLRAANKSPKTIRTYADAALQLGAWLPEQGETTDPRNITGAQIEHFLGGLIVRTSASTAATRYRGPAAVLHVARPRGRDRSVAHAGSSHCLPVCLVIVNLAAGGLALGGGVFR
jgi:integrase-like protein